MDSPECEQQFTGTSACRGERVLEKIRHGNRHERGCDPPIPRRGFSKRRPKRTRHPVLRDDAANLVSGVFVEPHRGPFVERRVTEWTDVSRHDDGDRHCQFFFWFCFRTSAVKPALSVMIFATASGVVFAGSYVISAVPFG